MKQNPIENDCRFVLPPPRFELRIVDQELRGADVRLHFYTFADLLSLKVVFQSAD